MKSVFVIALATLASATPSVTTSQSLRRNGSRYAFFRDLGAHTAAAAAGGGSRRVFGGRPAELAAFPGVCALLDRYWATRCSGAVLAPRWVVTAAHCVTPRLAYVKYNTRHPNAAEGDVTTVLYLYRHPKYKVVQEDEGRGTDVTVLHHDVGMVRTRDHMALAAALPADPVRAMRQYNPLDLHNSEVQVMGYGHTETKHGLGEELFAVRLRLVFCERGAWFHCVCGVAAGGAGGVCSGDSGGPVLYRGSQVGVTSMGPIECSAQSARSGPAETATSVFTALYRYAELVNATICDTEAALRMRQIDSRAISRRTAALLGAVALALDLVV